jgi:hypothetical protein
MEEYDIANLFYYLNPWRRMIALYIKRLQSNKTAMEIDRCMHYKNREISC